MRLGDKVCFGANIDSNEFKYILTERKGKSMLRQCLLGDEVMGQSSEKLATIDSTFDSSQSQLGPCDNCSRGDTTPPLATSLAPADRTQPMTTESTMPFALTEGAAGRTSNVQPPRAAAIVSFTTPSSDTRGNYRTASSGISGVKDPKQANTTALLVHHPSPSHPSPHCSPSITNKHQLCVDALFGEEPSMSVNNRVSEAIFGSPPAEEGPSALKRLKLESDAAVIQTVLAKEESDRERHALLSKIEALKSELEAKEKLLVCQDEADSGRKDEANSSMLSTMQEEFTCVICHELFVTAYTLPCAHSFCEWCIKEWTKSKRNGDCPICRKKITTDPVHSLVVDSAIEKIVDKLGPDAKEERRELKMTHELRLKEMGGCMTAVRPTPTFRTETHAITSARRAVVETISIPSPVRTSRERPIVLDESSSSSDSDDSDDSDDDSDDSDGYTVGLPDAYYGGYGHCFNCGMYEGFSTEFSFLHACMRYLYVAVVCMGVNEARIPLTLCTLYRYFHAGRLGHWAPGCPYS